MKVLITDAGYKNALCAIRSVGGHGATVIAGSSDRRAQGFYSRFTAAHFVYPEPADEDGFVDALLRQAERGIDVILPIGYAATRVLSANRQRIPEAVHLPVADWAAMEVASDKGRTMALAETAGVPTPRRFATPADVDHYPVVAKGALGAGNVHYARTRPELDAFYREGMLIQEYIPGDGYGFYALYDHGAEKAAFMHRRIREFPVTGGASTAAESFRDPVLAALGRKLLSALGWHGVAMVEFKRDRRDGTYKLMEINPKFWGSLDLAVAAGVDFPWLAVEVAAGIPFEPVTDYPTGLRFQWAWEDLLHGIARPRDMPAVLRDLVSRRTRDDLRRDDWKPNAYAGLVAAHELVNHVRHGTLRYPHGRPPTHDKAG